MAVDTETKVVTDGSRLPEQAGLPASSTAQGPGKRPRLLRWLIVPLVVCVGVAAWFVFHAWQAAQPVPPLSASGTLEADEVLLTSQVGGQIVGLPVEEGQQVQSGDIVVRIDDSLIQMQLQEADVATRRQLEITDRNYVLKSPVNGVVTQVPVHVGEVAAPGETLVGVANLSRLKLTVYVHERDLARVTVGQALSVTADPFPGRAFSGLVTSINTQAEFTPRNVQTSEDRLNLVFGVNARVDNPDQALKPGMPVDVTFVEPR